MAEPRCKVGDLVRVKQGPNRDRFGTVVAPGNNERMAEIFGDAIWFVSFTSPVVAFTTTDRIRIQAMGANFPDSALEPYRPDASLLDKSVVQPLHNPLTSPEAA